MTERLSGGAYSRQSGAGAADWTCGAGAVAGLPAVALRSGSLGILLFVLGAVAMVYEV